MQRRVVIIGNGVAGITAARMIRKMGNDRIQVISAETDHFYSRTALMYIYMGHMRYEDTRPYEDGFWKKNRIELLRDYVEEIDADRSTLRLRRRGALPYDVLLIATGSKWRKHGWPGEDFRGVQGLYGMPDLRVMEAFTRGIKRAVLVGGGLIGIEMAEMLHSRGIDVTFLVRESGYMRHVLPAEESAMVDRELRGHHIDLRLETQLHSILSDPKGRVRAVATSDGEEIPCEFVGLTTGVAPNIDVVAASSVETRAGVLVNDCFETSIPNVYAAGDCAEFREQGIGHKPIEQLWYTARRHGWTVAHTICGRRMPYVKGVFFNSAKFFTVEYQTYGAVSPIPDESEKSVCWIDESRKKLIRINYEKETERVLGFNLLGIRFRHEVCEKWIAEQRSLRYVLENLAQANFDPELFRRFEPAVVAQYNANNPNQQIYGNKTGDWFGRFKGFRRRTPAASLHEGGAA